MKLNKQTVYLPVNEQYEYSLVYWDKRDMNYHAEIDKNGEHISLKEQKGYFFTPEQLNEYTQKVIKESLETAAEKATTIDTYKTRWSGLNKEGFVEKDVYQESITNTFGKTFKKFKV